MTDDPLALERAWARDWLFDAALPLWWDVGADKARGGWVERIDQQGRATDDDRRCRVQGRQVFVYAHAGRLGWDGPWQAAVRHGLDALLKFYRRPDGLFRGAVTPGGAAVKEDYDLYDQAFCLLAFVSGYTALGRPQALRDEGDKLLAILIDTLAHPVAGFENASPPTLPLRSNPHMHMLEALLAWVQAGGGAAFAHRARQIRDLALHEFIDPATGAVGEYFDADWRFMPGAQGEVREPGHQFEWAYLIHHAADVIGGPAPEAVRRLHAFGAAHGVDAARDVAVFEMDATGTITDPDARLWSQCERLRTAIVLGHIDEAKAAFAALRRFLDVPVRGLWLDRMKPDGHIVDEPAPASSFYHIVSSLLPLLEG